jgi:hypothetical protein
VRAQGHQGAGEDGDGQGFGWFGHARQR